MKVLHLAVFLAMSLAAVAWGVPTRNGLEVIHTGFPISRFQTLDQDSQIIIQDDNRPVYAFRFPDAYGDDLRNQRFQAPYRCKITGVFFAFATRDFQQWTTGTPDLIVKVWPSDDDSFPIFGGEWISDTVAFSGFSDFVFDLDSTWRADSSQFVYADLSTYDLFVESGFQFHVGYTAALESGDSLAILSDDGVPETSVASEWYDGHFHLMREGWRGVNFFIRVVIESEANGTQILAPVGVVRNPSVKAYPNPFNSRTTITIDLSRSERARLSVYDLLGRERNVLLDRVIPAGRHEVTMNADGWSSGVYFLRLETASSDHTQRILLEK